MLFAPPGHSLSCNNIRMVYVNKTIRMINNKRCVRIFHIQNADMASTFTSAFLQKDQDWSNEISDRLFHWKLLRSIYHLITIFFWEIHSIFLSDHIFCICLDSEKAANVYYRFVSSFALISKSQFLRSQDLSQKRAKALLINGHGRQSHVY